MLFRSQVLYIVTSQITMTTDWLLLLLVVVSSQTVDSQSTTDDETCGEGGLLSRMQSDIERLHDNQQQLFQQHRTLMNSIRKLQQQVNF